MHRKQVLHSHLRLVYEVKYILSHRTPAHRCTRDQQDQNGPGASDRSPRSVSHHLTHSPASRNEMGGGAGSKWAKLKFV